MARTRTTTTAKKPGLMDRLGARRSQRVHATTTTSHSTNPLTGSHTTTRKTKTHPRGVGHHGHGGRGPLASNTTTTHHTAPAPATHHHQRKPSMGDKVSGALTKLRGSLTNKPGVKAAGTRRMHGTDGRGSTRRY